MFDKVYLTRRLDVHFLDSLFIRGRYDLSACYLFRCPCYTRGELWHNGFGNNLILLFYQLDDWFPTCNYIYTFHLIIYMKNDCGPAVKTRDGIKKVPGYNPVTDGITKAIFWCKFITRYLPHILVSGTS